MKDISLHQESYSKGTVLRQLSTLMMLQVGHREKKKNTGGSPNRDAAKKRARPYLPTQNHLGGGSCCNHNKIIAIKINHSQTSTSLINFPCPAYNLHARSTEPRSVGAQIASLNRESSLDGTDYCDCIKQHSFNSLKS